MSYKWTHMLMGLTLACLFLASSAWAGRGFFQENAEIFLPAGARYEEALEGSQMAARIDRAILRIFSTESGKSFCAATDENFSNFKNAFFIGESEAQRAYSLCRSRFSKKLIHRQHQKRYFLATTPETEFLVDGWTSPKNETYLILSEQELADDHRLTRSLIHELAVSLDRKEQLGFGGFIDTALIGIVKDADSPTIARLLHGITIQHTLSAIRAFEVEKRIGGELNIPFPEGFAEWGDLTCPQKIRVVSVYVSQLKSASLAEELINRFFHDAPQTIPLGEAAKYLESKTFHFQDGTSRNVCDYMTEGWPFLAGTSFAGGPGPRIGGGWAQIKQLQSQKIPNPKEMQIEQVDQFQGSTNRGAPETRQETVDPKDSVDFREVLRNARGSQKNRN